MVTFSCFKHFANTQCADSHTRTRTGRQPCEGIRIERTKKNKIIKSKICVNLITEIGISIVLPAYTHSIESLRHFDKYTAAVSWMACSVCVCDSMLKPIDYNDENIYSTEIAHRDTQRDRLRTRNGRELKTVRVWNGSRLVSYFVGTEASHKHQFTALFDGKICVLFDCRRMCTAFVARSDIFSSPEWNSIMFPTRICTSIVVSTSERK